MLIKQIKNKTKQKKDNISYILLQNKAHKICDAIL